MRKLNDRQNRIHKRSLKVATFHGRAEQLLVECLIGVEAEIIHKLLGYRSMFLYATQELKLSEAVALALISVARKAKHVHALRAAVAEGRVSPSKASRIVAHITIENAEEIISFASSHSTREIDFEMARRNPKKRPPERIKPISADDVQITTTINMKAFDDLQRTQSVLAQKGKPANIGNAIEASLEVYLNTHDPVRKAKRAKAKKVCLHRVKTREETRMKRVPLTAAQEHAVYARDGGRCTHEDPQGHRCNSDRWVHIHHIVHVSRGGTNDLENLTTLCSFHHDMVHQLSFGLDGDVNWFR
jgi:hypothetical protein